MRVYKHFCATITLVMNVLVMPALVAVASPPAATLMHVTGHAATHRTQGAQRGTHMAEGHQTTDGSLATPQTMPPLGGALGMCIVAIGKHHDERYRGP